MYTLGFDDAFVFTTGVICGALHIADSKVQTAFNDFQVSLSKGQVLPSNSLKNVVDVEFIYEGVKYTLQVMGRGVYI
ncbi:hypothetical protein DPMN_049643 [Dreissena polymorpha]|uniref:Acetyl-CoA carboxylase BT domain-containing protein n=1 Tax=Dreissena polymorpha TaxID=45954 RepID=A0A9D4CFY6_DREPO|nr:hypothetical protein DPMN_049643 [Dreissena polymorpha]